MEYDTMLTRSPFSSILSIPLSLYSFRFRGKGATRLQLSLCTDGKLGVTRALIELAWNSRCGSAKHVQIVERRNYGFFFISSRACLQADNGGLVMVTFYNYFVKCGPQASISDVAEHIYYIRNLIGVDHIGVGGDFDGINKYVGDEISRRGIN